MHSVFVCFGYLLVCLLPVVFVWFSLVAAVGFCFGGTLVLLHRLLVVLVADCVNSVGHIKMFTRL